MREPPLTAVSPAASTPSPGDRARLLPPVLDALPCPVAVVAGRRGRILAANAAWSRLFELAPSPDLLDLFPLAPEVAAVLAAPAPLSCRGLRARMPPGCPACACDLDVTPHPELPGLVLVTARKAPAEDEAELALRDSERLLRTAQEAAGVGVFERDLLTERAIWSPGMFRLYGLDPSRDGGPIRSLDDFLALIDPRDRERHLAEREANKAQGGTRFSFEFRIRRADTGEVRWIASRGEIEREPGSGRPLRVLGVNFDITEAREASEALAQSEERLRLAHEAGGLGSWEMDLASRELVREDGLYRLAGLAPDMAPQRGGTAGSFAALILPEDRPLRDAALRRALEGEDGGAYNVLFRIRRADTGELRWIASRGRLLPGADGGPARLIGVSQDVTARRQANAMLERYHAIAQQLRDVVLFLDLDGRVLDANAAAEAAYGHDRATLLTLNIRDLRAPDTVAEVPDQMLRAAASGILFETEHRRADGSRFPVEVSGAGAEIGGEKVLVSVVRDITDRRRAEAALRDSAARLARVQRIGRVGGFEIDLRSGLNRRSAEYMEVQGLAAQETLERHADWVRRLHPEDRARAERRFLAAIADDGSDTDYAQEYRIVTPAGEVRWIAARAEIERDAEGRALRMLGAHVDITELKTAEAALRDSEARFRGIAETAHEGIWLIDPEARTLFINERLAGLLGYQAAEMIGRKVPEFCFPEDLPAAREEIGANLAGKVRQFDFRFRRRDGTALDVLAATSPMRGPDGLVIGALGMFSDLTERKRAEAALAESEAQLRDLLATLDIGAFMTRDMDGTIRFWSAGCEALYGWTAAEAVGRRSHDLLRTEFPMPLAEIEATLARNGEWVGDLRQRTRTGTEILVIGRKVARFGPDGRPVAVVESLTDVTAHRRAEAALVESEARFRQLAEAVDDACWLCEPDAGRVLYLSPAFARIFGRPVPELPGSNRAWIEAIHPEDRDRAVDTFRTQALTTGFDMEYRIRRPDGTVRWVRDRAWPVPTPPGAPRRAAGIAVDITETKQAEAALAESEARFRALIEAMPQIGFIIRADGRVDYFSPRWYEFTGQAPGAGEGKGWMAALHAEDRDRNREPWRQAMASGETYEAEHRIRRHDGGWRWHLVRAVPLARGLDGAVRRWFGTATDITEIVAARDAAARANEELERRVAERTRALSEAARELQAEIRRREEVQAALLQSQKLEALGQLTGGVAHDFNNILAAIQGGYRLLQRRMGDNDRGQELIRQGQHAAERGARLIAQLMGFARRQELHPTLVDPAAVLSEAEDMICHTVGSRIGCRFELAEEIWPVLVDPVRLETVLLNLVANARDALPRGGEVVVAARNAEAGELPPELPSDQEYVRISVTDNGEGMSAETLRRAAEPFFTTKPLGKGTGLGLASAHGFAAQSGGALRLSSAPGKGTQVEIFLPRAAVLPADEDPDEAPAQPPGAAKEGEASILVVDDDDSVRPVTAALLRDLGYRVIEAPSAEAAEALMHAETEIDMLVTDVVMPGAPGHVLARRLRAERPGLPVLYITGHAGSARLDDAPVLRKPFTDAALARAIHNGLGRRSRIS